ncbi:MAG: helix-turn-helix domain-containing protein [Kosmotogaceae bacterium]
MRISRDKQKTENYVRKFDLQEVIGKDLLKSLELHFFERDENVFSIDEKPDYLYFLVKGKVKISLLLKNGSRMLMRFSIPLSMLGDLEVLNDYTVKTSVSAVCKSELLALDISVAGKYLIDKPAFLRMVIRELAFKLYHNDIVRTLTSSAPLKKRVATYLLLMTSDERNERMLDELETESQTEISELLGGSYRHVNRVMKELSDDGVIAINRSQIKIIDFEKLKNIASDLYG